MATASRTNPDLVQDLGPVGVSRRSELGGYTVEFVTVTEGVDLAPMLASLPGGNCSCPHWGYVISGHLIIRYPDREETVHAGEAFYMSPGHAPEASSGAEFVIFSPTHELEVTEAAIHKAMQSH